MKLTGPVMLAVLASIIALPIAAHADVVGSTFEQPLYTVGTIDGQQGWSEFGPYDVEVAGVPAILQPAFGDQALRASNAVTSGSFGDQAIAPSVVDGAGESTSVHRLGASGGVRQSFVELSFQVASAVPDAEQPGAGISVALSNGRDDRMGQVRVIDTPTGLEMIYSDVPGTTVPSGFRATTIASGLSRDAAHGVRVRVQFVEGSDNDIVTLFVDGTQRTCSGEPCTTWENYYRLDPEQAPNGNTVPVIDTALFLARGTAAPATAGAGLLFDDVRVETYGGANGPQGPIGPQGPQGVQGAQGPQGVQGAQGAQGVQGDQGLPGPAGNDGDDGDDGSNGVNGANGVNGKDGAAGPAGPVGPQGPAGVAAQSALNPVTVTGLSVRKGKKALVTARVSCLTAAGLCEGELRVFTTSGRFLGRQGFDLDGGRSVTLSLRLSTGATKALTNAANRVRITGFSRDRTGAATRVSTTARATVKRR